MVLHYVEPWLSNSDIEAGERWAMQVAKELEATKFGVICVTRDNLNSAWILFEAGALAKSMQEGRVVPLLLDIEFKDITGPLAQFQAKKFDRGGLFDVISSINKYSEMKISDQRLGLQFDALWPTLEEKVGSIPKDASGGKSNRPQSEVLEELVTSVRGLELRFRETLEVSPRSRRRRLNFQPVMIEEMLHRLKMGRSDPARFLLIGSFLKDDFPWLYELGLEAYRLGNAGNPTKYREAKQRFLSGCDLLRRGPFLEMITDKETHFLMREIFHLLEKSEPEPVDDTDNAVTLADKQSLARTKGYTGEACSECGFFTLVRNGGWLKCDTCGAMTGSN